jgi:hypothetical protein
MSAGGDGLSQCIVVLSATDRYGNNLAAQQVEPDLERQPAARVVTMHNHQRGHGNSAS